MHPPQLCRQAWQRRMSCQQQARDQEREAVERLLHVPGHQRRRSACVRAEDLERIEGRRALAHGEDVLHVARAGRRIGGRVRARFGIFEVEPAELERRGEEAPRAQPRCALRTELDRDQVAESLLDRSG